MIVLKFGGTSVGSPVKILNVAKIIARLRKKHKKVVVVVSAMGDSTDELIQLATEVSPFAQNSLHKREMDMLLTTGERISMSLLSIALGDLRIKARSFTGSQSGIITTSVHGEARINEIRPIRIQECLNEGTVAIVAGFQGVSLEKEITTLGRGGSDTSAVALGAALRAKEVIIFTDVDGVMSADPRIVKKARTLKKLSWSQALALASKGASVLHPRCVELALSRKLRVRVCSTFKALRGDTYVMNGGSIVGETSLEVAGIQSIAVQKDLCAFEKKLGTKEMAQIQSAFCQTSEGLDQLDVGVNMSEKTRVLLKGSDAKEFRKSFKGWKEEGDLARISVFGLSLKALAPRFHKVYDRFSKKKPQILEYKLSSNLAEFLCRKECADELTRALHDVK